MEVLTVYRPPYGETKFRDTSKKKVLEQLRSRLISTSDEETHGVSFHQYRNKKYTLVRSKGKSTAKDLWLIQFTHDDGKSDEPANDFTPCQDRMDAVAQFLKLCVIKGDHWN